MLSDHRNLNIKLYGFPHPIRGEHGLTQVLPQSQTDSVTQREAIVARGATQKVCAEGEILLKEDHYEP
jgi:hypothetical protein